MVRLPHQYVAFANVDVEADDPASGARPGQPRLPSCVRRSHAVDRRRRSYTALPRWGAAAIFQYTKGSRRLNQYLAQRWRGEVEEDPRMERWADYLCKALRCLSLQISPVCIEATCLWRGCNLTERQIDWYAKREGRIVQWSSFTSCSSERWVAEQLADKGLGKVRFCVRRFWVLFEIHRDPAWPTGADIQQYAEPRWKWECETLLIPGCRFRVLDVKVLARSRRGAAQKYIITLQERQLQAHKGANPQERQQSPDFLGFVACDPAPCAVEVPIRKGARLQQRQQSPDFLGFVGCAPAVCAVAVPTRCQTPPARGFAASSRRAAASSRSSSCGSLPSSSCYTSTSRW